MGPAPMPWVSISEEGGLKVNFSLPLLLVSNAVLGVCGIPMAVERMTNCRSPFSDAVRTNGRRGLPK